MVLNIWCDDCYDFVDEVTLGTTGNGNLAIRCTCGNILMKDIPEKEQNKLKIKIAKAIWNL